MFRTFLLHTSGKHLIVVGLAYLVFMWWLPEPTEDQVGCHIVFAAIIGAIYYPFAVLKHRPVPRNPVQQFMINLWIFVYSAIVAACFALPSHASLDDDTVSPMWPAWVAFYLFFACWLLYGVDHPVVEDATNRKLTEWQLAMLAEQRSRRNKYADS